MLATSLPGRARFQGQACPSLGRTSGRAGRAGAATHQEQTTTIPYQAIEEIVEMVQTVSQELDIPTPQAVEDVVELVQILQERLVGTKEEIQFTPQESTSKKENIRKAVQIVRKRTTEQTGDIPEPSNLVEIEEVAQATLQELAEQTGNTLEPTTPITRTTVPMKSTITLTGAIVVMKATPPMTRATVAMKITMQMS